MLKNITENIVEVYDNSRADIDLNALVYDGDRDYVLTFQEDELIQKRITEFNSYFSEISSQLDGELSLLSADNSNGVYKFKIAFY